NTGWTREGDRFRLSWSGEPDAFAGWRADVGQDAGEFSTRDFDDLRIATATADPGSRAPRLQLHYERANHLFRYNRVEGAYLGVGARFTSADPLRDRWQLYGTAGWAFAEGTPRGEVGVGWGAAVAPAQTTGRDWGARGAAYRRIRDIQP